MILTTSPAIDHHSVVQHLGLVTGEAVRANNILVTISAFLRDIVGGRSGNMEMIVRLSREAALEGMVTRAKALGADAVIGISFNYTNIQRLVVVSVVGTAVRLGSRQSNQNPR